MTFCLKLFIVPIALRMFKLHRHLCHLYFTLNVPSAAAKLLQSCLTLCNPIDGSPPGSSVHGIFQARVLEWAAIAFSGEVYKASLKSVRQVLS